MLVFAFGLHPGNGVTTLLRSHESQLKIVKPMSLVLLWLLAWPTFNHGRKKLGGCIDVADHDKNIDLFLKVWVYMPDFIVEGGCTPGICDT